MGRGTGGLIGNRYWFGAWPEVDRPGNLAWTVRNIEVHPRVGCVLHVHGYGVQGFGSAALGRMCKDTSKDGETAAASNDCEAWIRDA